MDRIRQPNVPRQYLGFSLQVNRLLWHLLHAQAGDAVSLEVLGDVAVTSSSGETEVEEVKSRTDSTSNPVANRSVDLWKTLRNWIDAVSNGLLDPRCTHFSLYTTRPFSSDFLTRLVNATEETSEGTIDAICGELWGEAPEFPKKGHTAAELQPHLEKIFSPEGRDALRQILPRFSYRHGNHLPKEELLTSLRTKAIANEALDDVLYHLLGWVKSHTDQLIARGEPAYVFEPDFHLELVSFVRKIHCQHILHSFAPPLPSERVAEHLGTSTYIMQLDIVEAEYDDKLRAISDHFRAEIDRIEWAAKGLVNPTTFDELEDELLLAWKHHQRVIEISHRDKSEVDRGKLLLDQCCLHRCPIQGSEAPPHFTRGCFHVLADDLALGWHPSYRSLLHPPPEKP